MIEIAEQILKEARSRKTSQWPTCCPWSIARTQDIVSLAEEYLRLVEEVKSNQRFTEAGKKYLTVVSESSIIRDYE